LTSDSDWSAINNRAKKLIFDRAQATIALRLFGFFKIPMMLYVRPSVTEISDERVVVRIPLRRRTRNHIGSMYFGALGVGADCSVGALAMHLTKHQPEKISMIFKNFSAEFLKRAEGDVDFCCIQGNEIAKLIAVVAASDERNEIMVDVIATVPDQGNEPVATFKMTLSMKKQA